MPMIKIIVSLLLILLTYGCASDHKVKVLDDSLKVYSAAIRWGDFHGATKFFKNPALVNKVDFNKLKSIKVTSYNVVQTSMSNSGSQLNQIVIIRFYDSNDGREREITDKQLWEYNEERELWLLITPMPAFQ